MSKDRPEKTKYRVVVDEGKCLGCGTCAAVAEKTFEVEEVARVVDQDGNSDEEKLLAAQSCPGGAIEVWQGEKKIWPNE